MGYLESIAKVALCAAGQAASGCDLASRLELGGTEAAVATALVMFFVSLVVVAIAKNFRELGGQSAGFVATLVGLALAFVALPSPWALIVAAAGLAWTTWRWTYLSTNSIDLARLLRVSRARIIRLNHLALTGVVALYVLGAGVDSLLHWLRTRDSTLVQSLGTFVKPVRRASALVPGISLDTLKQAQKDIYFDLSNHLRAPLLASSRLVVLPETLSPQDYDKFESEYGEVAPAGFWETVSKREARIASQLRYLVDGEVTVAANAGQFHISMRGQLFRLDAGTGKFVAIGSAGRLGAAGNAVHQDSLALVLSARLLIALLKAEKIPDMSPQHEGALWRTFAGLLADRVAVLHQDGEIELEAHELAAVRTQSTACARPDCVQHLVDLVDGALNRLDKGAETASKRALRTLVKATRLAVDTGEDG